MSSATSYGVLKNLKDANTQEVNSSQELQPYASVATHLEIDFFDVVLLTCVILCANIGFKLLEKLLDWIIAARKREKQDTASKDTL